MYNGPLHPSSNSAKFLMGKGGHCRLFWSKLWYRYVVLCYVMLFYVMKLFSDEVDDGGRSFAQKRIIFLHLQDISSVNQNPDSGYFWIYRSPLINLYPTTFHVWRLFIVLDIRYDSSHFWSVSVSFLSSVEIFWSIKPGSGHKQKIQLSRFPS